MNLNFEKPKTKAVNIRIEEDLYAKILKTSKKNKTSISKVIKNILNSYFI